MTVPAGRNTEDEDQDSELPPPPDGGWGWMVVFASFMIHIVTDGVTYSFGIFYDEFLGYFQEGKGATAWILSILVGVTFCSGPISSSFVNRWGCRSVTIAGAILASICMIISSRAQNVTTLYFTIGIGTGLGFGLIYLPAIVSVTMYFEKKRSLATGIAVCGSGFGTFIFAPIINLLLTEYGWRGAMLIISAIVLKCTIFGALFRPLEYEVDKSSIKNELVDLKPVLLKTDISSSDHNLNEPEHKTVPMVKIQRPHSMTHLSKSHKHLTENTKYTPVPEISSKFSKSQPAINSSHREHGRHHLGNQLGSQSLKRSRPAIRPDAFYQYSLQNLSMFKSKLDIKEGSEVEAMIRRPSVSSKYKHTHKEEEPKTTICGFVPCSEETKETLSEMLDFSLFKDPIFILFTLSNFCTSIGFNIPYVYIVSKAKTLNISSDSASILLSVIGVANTVGRIILGYISDNPKINRLWIYNFSLAICGLATAFSAFCLDFYSLAVYCSVYGFTIGAYVGLTSVILVDLLGLEKLTNAFGLLLLFQGIASLIGPPIAGELYDWTGSYDPGFYVAGVTIAASGLMLFAIPYLQRKRSSQNSVP